MQRNSILTVTNLYKYYNLIPKQNILYVEMVHNTLICISLLDKGKMRTASDIFFRMRRWMFHFSISNFDPVRIFLNSLIIGMISRPA